ncbi:MAG: hypothetical protein RL358_1156 [Pseudomonadota bacterium]|jgi:type I restriction enzyme M protein
MLDAETKRRIDSCRDILVGKVPDPKSQVEQITIALIYKFMDDMDAEAEELGGSRSFFTGDYAKYGWAKLMRSGLGGHETLNLYAEAIAKMPENPGIPALFRDIFKNAYLPYRDPETLRSFLKEIDVFSYDHSEKLGDAFEYLLSVLGSQGDAGQFRTPRHIIDFMVDVMNPQKNESMLDPACGTAGFLISAWKHILKTNTKVRTGDQLTPDERTNLAANIHGYDISPDMVRLSLVNLYLHGFSDPHVVEYDTLTSEEKWNETADVILANPPFMSPKGGIKPHKRFSIDASRSEVLFVDYIAEHLSPNGRAAIVVPEGIIFQSQTAYKSLRKLLVEKYLIAVISLPAGVFNPYSGVKTSILILDKRLAKTSNSIAFLKVENDGFGLGAQRRAFDKNDLPQIKVELDAYLQALRSQQPTAELQFTRGLIVIKEKIAANGDYNLSGERYREGVISVSSWPFVSVGTAFRKGNQSVLPESLDGPVTYLGLENITQHTGEIEGSVVTEKPADIKSLKNVFKPRDILYGKLRPNLNKVWLADRNGICSTDIFVIEAIEETTDPALYAYLFRSSRFNDAVMGQLKGAQLPRIGWSSFEELQIPLPPLEVQKEIVAEIDGYQKIIDGARSVLDNYRPQILIQPDWPMEAFGEVTSTITPPAKIQAGDFRQSGQYPVIDQSQNPIAGRTDDESSLIDGTRGLVIFGDHTCAVKFIKGRFAQGADGIKIIKADEQLEPKFVYYYLLSHPIEQDGYKRHFGKLKESRIAVPPLVTQQAIVAEIEAEQALVAANHELIARFENKIQASLARVWGEDITVANTSEDKL